MAHESYDAVIAPVWIALPMLPESCWFLEFLMVIRECISRFICVDHPTTSMARPSMARICVKVDLSKDLLIEISIKHKSIHWQKIVYQNMPS